MATIIKPEDDENLAQLAERTHGSKDEALEDSLNQALAYNDWFEAKVKEGLAAIDRGEVVADEDVRAWIEQRERS
jgi:predicted transcriptional regulator